MPASAPSSAASAGTLYVVSTPIGNLGDFSRRGIETLSSVQLIVAEDTRHSKRLLDHHGIQTAVSSYHEHNEAKETPRLVARLIAGDSIALISDAGTPLLSDPGSRLVAAAVEAGVRVVPIPGASAVMAALVASGLPVDRFTFFGFLPRKGRERRDSIAGVIDSRWTVALFESPNRVAATLGELAAEGGGERRAVVARELTKQFEEFKRGTVSELAAIYEEKAPRGEVVILIAGREEVAADEEQLEQAAADLRAAGGAPREIMDRLIAEHGAPRNLAYRLAHATAS